MKRRRARVRARLIGLAASVLATILLWRADAGATLYSAAGGYQHTGGSEHYWGEEFWGYGSARLDGGWYPFGRLSLVNDAFYKWVVAPGAGLEKGLPGIGKARLGYTYYRGDARLGAFTGTSHAYEAGLSRAFTPTVTGDLAFSIISGDLFTGAKRELDGRVAATGPRHSVVHQLQTALGWDWSVANRKVRVEGVLSGAKSSDARRFLAESLNLAVPVVGPWAVSLEGTLVQNNNGAPRYFAGAGIVYAVAGRWIKGTPD